MVCQIMFAFGAEIHTSKQKWDLARSLNNPKKIHKSSETECGALESQLNSKQRTPNANTGIENDRNSKHTWKWFPMIIRRMKHEKLIICIHQCRKMCVILLFSSFFCSVHLKSSPNWLFSVDFLLYHIPVAIGECYAMVCAKERKGTNSFAITSIGFFSIKENNEWADTSNIIITGI